ncbi:hypothetical protein ACEPT7_14330 [Burkholderia ubonensis]|uniref:hypothetical protein n=1 Tax=Burkholderia ubonensis TaxID=101571 RepID=UPI00358F8230
MNAWILALRSRSAFEMTEAELMLIASAAIIGLRKRGRVVDAVGLGPEPATLSAIRCMGARDRRACATIRTICDSTVWECGALSSRQAVHRCLRFAKR